MADKGLKGVKLPELKGKRFHDDDLKKALIALGGSIVLVAALHGADTLATNMAAARKAASMTPAGEFTPGTYSAEAQGIGTVKVTLTFNETNLMEAELDTSQETPDIGGVATETLKQALLDGQSPVIDAVAGATVTSDAVMAAAQKAWNEAAGIVEEEPAEEEAAEEAAEEPAEEAPLVKAEGLTPGEYTGSAQGIGEVSATVTIGEDGSIADVVLNLDQETPEIGGAAGDTLKEEILAAQSADIEAVAGATVTTEAVKAAVNGALAQAAGGAAEAEAAQEEPAEEAEAAAPAALVPGEYTASATGMGDVTVTATVGEDGTITDVVLGLDAETPEIGGAAGDALKEQVLAAQGAEIEGVAGATITTEAVKTAVADILAQAAGSAEAAAEEVEEAVEDAAVASAGLIPGEYTANAMGMGDVTVTATVGEDGTITDLVLGLDAETPEIGGAAGDALKEQVLAAQGAEIEGVAGATITTEAVKTAVADILAQAAGSAEAAAEEVEEAAVASAGLVPGEYTASATGMGDVTVTATVGEDGTITDVVLGLDAETPEIGGAAGDALKEQVLAAQGAEIEGVAGATITTEAVKTAVADILAQAAGSAEAAAEEAEAAPAAGLTPGEYTASATGMGDVTVTATVGEDGTITDLVLGLDAETPEIGGAAGDALKEQVLAAQGAEIEGVAGATITTEAVKTAVADILAQAGK